MENLWSLSNMTRVHVDSVLPYRVHFVPLEYWLYSRFLGLFFGRVVVVLITPAAAQSATWCFK
jgi:hypothetical protein